MNRDDVVHTARACGFDTVVEGDHAFVLDSSNLNITELLQDFAEAVRIDGERWIAAAHRLPEPGQLVVKRWSNGNVWAGRHVAHPKHESFAEWMPL